MRYHVVSALIRRCFHSTFKDKGRVSELVVFPFSFLIIWGFFLASGMVDREIAGQLMLINLIWSVSGTFQTQANLSMMFDLWSREFPTILRQGVKTFELVSAQLIFSTAIGLLNLAIFIFFVLYGFGGTPEEVSTFITLFPLYYISSIGLAMLFGGFVMYLGRTYAFISWTGLQILIMISSPFAPISTLPAWLVKIVLLSPFTYIFEYVRSPAPEIYLNGLIASVIYFMLGVLSSLTFYNLRRAKQGLMEV